MSRIINFLKTKKLLLLTLIIILGIVGYFFFFGQSNQSNVYILTRVQKGEINKYVSGSGNIVSVDNLDLRPTVSGKIIYLGVKEGNYVSRGQLLVKLDTSDLEKQIRDLEFTLQNQQINLEKLKDNYEQVKRGDDLKKIYQNNLTTFNNIFNSYPQFFDQINAIYFNDDFNDQVYKKNLEYYLSYENSNYRELTEKYKNDLDNLKKRFVSLSKDFDFIKSQSVLNENFVASIYDFNTDFANYVKFGLDLSRKIKDNQILTNARHTKQTVIENHISQLNSLYNNLLPYNSNLIDIKNAINSYYDKIKSLEYDIKNSDVNIEQTKTKIDDLKNDLKDYYVYSPLNGYVNTLNVKVNDLVGSGTILMNLVSKDRIAEIKLNEVDLAGVKVGSSAILTFDSLPNLKINGQVIFINPIGEVAQGVVSYKLKISFKDNPQVKIGMTVNADIVIDSKKDVLVVPNSAIKTMGNRKYVEIPDEKENLNSRESRSVALEYPPKMVFIKTGLSDDKNTEILEGLKDGDLIILRKISGSNNSNQFSQNQQQNQQGLFQRLMPQPRQFIRSPGTR
jgi:HlyD family secretion protein